MHAFPMFHISELGFKHLLRLRGIVEATTLNYNYNDPNLLAAYGEHTPQDALRVQSSTMPGTRGERCFFV